MREKLDIFSIFGLSPEDRAFLEAPVNLEEHPLGVDFKLKDRNRSMQHRFFTRIDLYGNPVYFVAGLEKFDTAIKILRESNIGNGVHDLRTCFISDPETHQVVAIGWYVDFYYNGGHKIVFLDIDTLEMYPFPENMEITKIDARNPKPEFKGIPEKGAIKSNQLVPIPGTGVKVETFKFYF